MKKLPDRTYLILFAVLMLVLFLPMIQQQTGLFKLNSLSGVVVKTSKPELNYEDFKDNKYQAQLEKYVSENYGFRESSIRLYNQYLWDFYRKTNATKWQIVMGKEGWFYEPWFVEDYYQGGTYKQSCDSAQLVQRFEEEAYRIYQLQHILELYGTHLFVCLLPGKDMVYSEYLPENKKYTKKKFISARDYFGPKFKELGINHVNVEQWFLQMKDTVSFPLFPKTGTHWSNIASLYVADSVIRYMEELGDVNIRNLKIGDAYIDETRDPDDDLESLMNLIRPLDQNYNQYADVVSDGDMTAVKPKIIVIGDSFFWNISRQLPMLDIFAAAPYWYYNSTIYYDDENISTKDIDLLKELLSADFVILSYCSLQLYDMSNDFSKNALLKICLDSTDLVQKRHSLEEYIRSDKEWFAAVVEKGKEEGFTDDEALASNVSYIIENEWKKFYPELCDSVPQRRSASFMQLLAADTIINVEKLRIEKSWRESKEIMDMLEGKAKKSNIPVDSVMKAEVQAAIDKKIESDGILGMLKSAYR